VQLTHLAERTRPARGPKAGHGAHRQTGRGSSPWAEEAARLGWTDLDLFGVRRRPALYPDWRPGPRAGARAFSILLSQVEARAYSATKPIGERTGLGLSISW